MTARRFFTALGILAVTAVAGAISYRHQSELALHNGQPALLAAIWPLCVDGLVAVCGIAISTDRAGGYRPRVWALVGFWTGVLVSVATNWLATPGGLIAHAVSAFPAVAFLVAVETLSGKPRAVKVTDQPDVEVAEGTDSVETLLSDIVSDTSAPVDQPKPRAPRAPKKATTADKVAAAKRRTPDASPAAIATRLGVTTRTVERHLAALAPVPVFTDAVSDTHPHNGSPATVDA